MCNKISENPRKGFLQLLAWGIAEQKKKKTNIFSNPSTLKLSFVPGHGMFHEKVAFWDTLIFIFVYKKYT